MSRMDMYRDQHRAMSPENPLEVLVFQPLTLHPKSKQYLQHMDEEALHTLVTHQELHLLRCSYD